jgi:hypothetical protein
MMVVAGTAWGDLDQVFRKGNDAYLHGDFKGAIEAYEQAASFGVESPDLYYNLGNAYFSEGDLGRAVWSYERALELKPGDDDATYNLAAARQAAAQAATDRIEGADRDPFLERIVAPLSLSTLTWTFLSLYVLFFGVIIWLRYMPTGLLRSAVKTASAFVASAGLITGLLLADKLILRWRVQEGVVLDPAVEVKAGADTTYTTNFDVHAGLKVRVIGRDQDWLNIQLANGLEGWVPDAAIGVL